MGRALGFSTQQPERATGVGPDNLWNITGEKFWVIECKSKVSLHRKEISKKEAGQLSNTIGWFKANYRDSDGEHILIHPANMFAKGAYVAQNIWCLSPKHIDKLKENVKSFFTSMQNISFSDLSVNTIQAKLNEYNLDTNALVAHYLKAASKYRVRTK